MTIPHVCQARLPELSISLSAVLKGGCAVYPALGVHLLQVVANGHLDEVQELCKLNSTASSEGLASTSESIVCLIQNSIPCCLLGTIVDRCRFTGHLAGLKYGGKG